MILHYEPEVPANIVRASENAFSLSWDSFAGEKLVFGQVLKVRCLRAGSSVTYLDSIGWNPKQLSSTVIIIDYEVWVMPADFAPENPEKTIYRRERVFVDADTLINDQLVTYGVGPVYNLFNWMQIEERVGSLADVNFPDERIELLADTITSLRGESIIEFLKEGGEMPEQMATPIFNAYKYLSAIAQSQLASEAREYRAWEIAEVARQNEDKLPFAELKFDVDAITRLMQNGIVTPTEDGRRLVFVMPSIHKSRLLYIFVSPLPVVDGGWSIEACIVRETRGGTIFFEQAKEKFSIVPASSVDGLESVIIAQIKDGSLAQRFRRPA